MLYQKGSSPTEKLDQRRIQEAAGRSAHHAATAAVAEAAAVIDAANTEVARLRTRSTTRC